MSNVTKSGKAALLSLTDQAFVLVSIVLASRTKSMEHIHHTLIENEHICLNIGEDFSVQCEAEQQDLSKVCRQ